MNLEKLFVLREKISHDDTLLRKQDRCAAESKYLYRYKLEYLMSKLIKHEKDIILLRH